MFASWPYSSLPSFPRSQDALDALQCLGKPARSPGSRRAGFIRNDPFEGFWADPLPVVSCLVTYVRSVGWLQRNPERKQLGCAI